MTVGMRVEDLDTPALWVDLEQLEANIQTLAQHFRAVGVSWRPHIKGIKVPAIAQKALAAGAIGVTCAKVAEAEIMAAAGIRDILVAHQVVTPRKIARLVSLARRTDVKVAVDCAANADRLGAAAREWGVELGVLIELNVGMNRAGVAPGEPALELVRWVAATPGLRYLGLMGWEGHTAGMADPETKRQEIVKSMTLLTSTARLCAQNGMPPGIVSGGGSGTYMVSSVQPGLTEMQAGGAMFSDVAYLERGAQTRPSLFVRATVTSRPAPDRIIVDAGFKAAPTWYVPPKPLGVEGVKEVRMSSEHGRITLDHPNTDLQVGDGLDMIVGYGDVTVFLHDVLYGARNRVVEAEWEIPSRGRSR